MAVSNLKISAALFPDHISNVLGYDNVCAQDIKTFSGDVLERYQEFSFQNELKL